MEHFEEVIQEKARVVALNRYLILDTLPEPVYDDVTALASLICGTPISLVSLVDADRQWFKSALGITVRETPRSQSFCAHTIPTAQTLIVTDAQVDSRFMANPLVVGPPGIRFYAGAPIIEPGGHVVGTVCVIDTVPRSLRPVQISALEALARHVMAIMELRRLVEFAAPGVDLSHYLSPNLGAAPAS
jgi:two-component system, NtrC family, sensor kinase